MEWQPSLLLADGSEAITKGYSAVFGPPTTRLMCYFHVLHNIEKYLKPLPTEVSKKIKADLTVLQSSQNESTF